MQMHPFLQSIRESGGEGREIGRRDEALVRALRLLYYVPTRTPAAAAHTSYTHSTEPLHSIHWAYACTHAHIEE